MIKPAKTLFPLALVLVLVCSCNGGAINTKVSATKVTPEEASVLIEANRTVRSIPPELFGTNIEWSMNMQGIWLTDRQCPDPEIKRLAKEAGIKVVRFPAGTGADYYHWEQGLGALNQRPLQKHVINDGQEVNYFGTDELAAFCNDISAQPLLTVNMITDSAASAARWVSYCNAKDSSLRARNGHASPHQIYFWELGNEPYMKQDNPSTRLSSISAEEYISKCNEYISAMRAQDKSIKIAAVGGNDFTRFSFLSDKDWNRKILSGLGNKIEMLSLHNGYAPLIVESTDYSVEEVYESLFAFPKLMEENLLDVSREIDTYVKPSPQNVGIAVTEWAPLFHVSTTSPWVDHTKTFGSGLYSAAVLHTLIRNRRVKASTFFKLKDFLYAGTIGFDNTPKSSFYALKMYSSLSGQNLIESTTNSPTYDAKALGLIPEIKKVPFLDVIVSKSQDNNKLSIYAINRSLSVPIKAHIEIKDFQPKSHCEIITFNAKNIDSNNGKDIPDVPGYSWARQKEATHNPQFQRGAHGEVQLQTSEFERAAKRFDYTFPCHSATCIMLTRTH